MNLEIDYTKLTVRELKDLINQHYRKAEEEYDRRVLSGEIKLKRYTLEEIMEYYRKKQAS